MANLSSHISSEIDRKAHITSYPELYEDLAVDALEERLEMVCIWNDCESDGDGVFCVVDLCTIDNDGDCIIDICGTDT